MALFKEVKDKSLFINRMYYAQGIFVNLHKIIPDLKVNFDYIFYKCLIKHLESEGWQLSYVSGGKYNSITNNGDKFIDLETGIETFHASNFSPASNFGTVSKDLGNIFQLFYKDVTMNFGYNDAYAKELAVLTNINNVEALSTKYRELVDNLFDDDKNKLYKYSFAKHFFPEVLVEHFSTLRVDTYIKMFGDVYRPESLPFKLMEIQSSNFVRWLSYMRYNDSEKWILEELPSYAMLQPYSKQYVAICYFIMLNYTSHVLTNSGTVKITEKTVEGIDLSKYFEEMGYYF